MRIIYIQNMDFKKSLTYLFLSFGCVYQIYEISTDFLKYFLKYDVRLELKYDFPQNRGPPGHHLLPTNSFGN